MSKVKEISYKDFPLIDDLASYAGFNGPSPAVLKVEEGYQIRIVKSTYTSRRGTTRYEWDYFRCDLTGLIIESPRGMSKEFTKRVRITDMEAFVEEYKFKSINQ